MQNPIETFYPKNRQEWREWLQVHHNTKESIWLIYYKKISNQPTVAYTDAVDEALCFGWIDSKQMPIDDEKFMQFFCKRKVKSVWSKVNKAKVARLTQEGLMTTAGLSIIEKAKENGSWTVLDEVEELIIPADLNEAFKKQPKGEAYFLGLSRSDKRNMLQWLVLAKRPETRMKRITEIVDLAAQGLKPKQFRGKSIPSDKK
jgi:uncharacterized protein YdeI (YjbR/CyaY-like superfamily)